jgi:succinyl-diaminopimelate desuccinylase
MKLLQKILSEIDEKQLIKLTRDLVKIPSVNPPGEYEDMLEFLMARLKDVGVDVHVVKCQNVPNILGCLGGQEGASALMFLAHMDVAPVEKEQWEVDPFSGTISGGRLFGRGASDMKGGISAMITAIDAIKKSDVELKRNLMIVITGDEETGGLKGMKYMAENHPELLRTDMAISGEPTDTRICFAHKGLSVYEITTRGKSVHSSSPEKGVNAIVKMCEILGELRKSDLRYKRHDVLGEPTISIQWIEGGARSLWSVPSLCTATVEVRHIPGQSSDSVRRDIAEKIAHLKDANKEIEAQVHTIRSKEPIELPMKDPAVLLLKKAGNSVFGEYPEMMATPAAAGDLYYLIQRGVHGVTFGPGNLLLAHKDNEFIEIGNLVKATKIYAACIFDACVREAKSASP